MSSLHDLWWGSFGVLGLIGISFLVFLFFVAPYQIHSDQLVALEKARGDLSAAAGALKAKDALLESRLPELRGEITAAITGLLKTDENSRELPFLALWMSLKNTGEPSIADGLQVWVDMPDGRRLSGDRVMLPADVNIPMHDDSGKVFRVMSTGDQLIYKVPTPITKGGAAYGFMIAAFPNVPIEDIRKDGAKYVVEFADIHGNRHSCSYGAKQGIGMREGRSIFLPGEMPRAAEPHQPNTPRSDRSTGLLTPGNGTMPVVQRMYPDALGFVLLGSVAAIPRGFPCAVLTVDGVAAIVIERANDSLQISGQFRDVFGQLICEIANNRFRVNLDTGYNVVSGPHSLSVTSGDGATLVKIDLINPKVVSIGGSFYVNDGVPVQIMPDAVKISTNSFGALAIQGTQIFVVRNDKVSMGEEPENP